ncbi:hypothetical protein CL617_01380 [archaeon]|nr:hypothetical protein [archaeon]|tara:strand:- start:1737 stop:2540 length:804 start_codon:yes stop_codon:yes gene_type:complete
MDFKIERNIRRNIPYIDQKDLGIAKKFATKVYKEFGTFISAIVLFGSVAQGKVKRNDIDLLIVINDVKIKIHPEIMEAYRVIVEKAILDISPKIHVQTMNYSSFWEYVRAGDPVAVNILRSGLALVDTGFFDPLQALLDSGRIRPSIESIQTYFTMSYASLFRSRDHLLSGAVDLYWAAIDAAHSALMSVGEIPPSPEHVAGMMGEKLVKGRKLDKKYVAIMSELYLISKKISNREIKFITGKEYDKLRDKTEDFVKRIKKFIEEKK